MPIKPRGEVIRSELPRPGYLSINEPQIEMTVWCPDAEAKAPPEQVHFIIHWPVGIGLPPTVIRFKSPDTLGFFIEELAKFRKIVWPNSESVNIRGDEHE